MSAVRRGRVAVGRHRTLVRLRRDPGRGPARVRARAVRHQGRDRQHPRQHVLAREPRSSKTARRCGGSTTVATCHNVTPGRRSTSYGSGNLKPGKSYVQTFLDSGTFAYYCTLHGTPTSGQYGKVSIGDAAAAIAARPRSVRASTTRPPSVRRVARSGCRRTRSPSRPGSIVRKRVTWCWCRRGSTGRA